MKLKFLFGLVLAFLLSCCFLAQALTNGQARTPAMGYNTWNDFGCSVNATDVMAAADALVSLGLDQLGYRYVNLDDCWAEGRLENGTIYADSLTFPDGIPPVANYIHSKGLKFGIYTDRGNKTCAGRPGSHGYEYIDAQTYASWGVDYLKEDSCHASQIPEVAFQEYGLMRDALNETGRGIYFSLCGWFFWYALVGQSLGNSWRIAPDCTDWLTVLNALDVNAELAEYAGPGGWNDPDMLIGSGSHSDHQTQFYLKPYQSRTQFSLWAIMSAPLLIGANILNLSSWDLETYSNQEVIALDQDPLGEQGIRLVGSSLFYINANYQKQPFAVQTNSKYEKSQNDLDQFKLFDNLKTQHQQKHAQDVDLLNATNVWGKKLLNGDVALIFINAHPLEFQIATIRCDVNCFAKLGWNQTTTAFEIRDLWQHKVIGSGTVGAGIEAVVEGGGNSKIYRLSQTNEQTEQARNILEEKHK